MDHDLELHDRRWEGQLRRRADGAPVLPPLFVVEQGPTLHLVDIRERSSGTGPAGYIPGSAFVPADELGSWLARLPTEARVVLVSTHGGRAARRALQLEKGGRERIAALEGGLAAWRRLGLRTSRDPAGLGAPAPTTPPARPSSPTLGLEDVRRHVGDPRSVRWIKTLAYFGRGRLSCIDGRDARGVVGTPGGDAGEFLLTLGALEATRGLHYEEEDIRPALLERFDLFGDFYVHTDADAQSALIRSIQADPRLRKHIPQGEAAEAWRDYLEDPPPADREALLEHVAVPAHVGCGHLRMLLEHSEAYGVRHELVLAFLRVMHRLLWENAPELHLTVLQGTHREGAVLRVLLEQDVWEMSWIPLIAPSYRGTQMFVSHPQVAALMRRKVAEQLSRSSGRLGLVGPERERYEAKLEEMGTRQRDLTLGTLARGLPLYLVRFDASGRFDVTEAGVVGA